MAGRAVQEALFVRVSWVVVRTDRVVRAEPTALQRHREVIFDASADLDQPAERALGIVGARAEAMIAIARAVSNGELQLGGGADPAPTISALCAIKGIGPWTAHYIAMRSLAWPDAWPPQDVALLNAMNLPNTAKGQREADATAEAWRPWRSYAVLHTWRRLEIRTAEPSLGVQKAVTSRTVVPAKAGTQA